jgi:phosphoenolpyruvate carboxykinase (ATP)
MKLGHTRAMVRAALDGRLAGVGAKEDPIFGLQVPEGCPDVPAEVLQPRSTWRDGRAYDEQARKLAGMFGENFKKFGNDVSPEIRSGAPRG